MAQYGACCDEGMLCRVRVVQAVIEGDELAGEVPALLADKNYDEALRSLEAAKTCYETAVAEDDYHARPGEVAGRHFAIEAGDDGTTAVCAAASDAARRSR